MEVYSHSRLSTFEQCQLKFKFHYIDKIETEIEQTIEAFMGDMVHQALEKLYKDLRFMKRNSLQDLLAFYNDLWQKNYNDAILIVRKDYTAENFRQMGEKFITDYYNTHEPFDDCTTIETEKRIEVKIEQYVLQGYIDRLGVKDGIYEIHDYKTASSLPLREYLEEDRQLALYSIAVRNDYPDAKRVKLIWHFLSYNKDVCIEKTDEQLEKLKKETVEIIKRIESAKEFPANVSALCDWCNFKGICPKWFHLNKTQNLPANEYLSEPGVVLANKYTELNEKKAEIEREMEKVKNAIYLYCEENNTDDLYGSDTKLAVRTYANLKFPAKGEPGRKEFLRLLKEVGLLEEVLDVDNFKLSRLLREKTLPDEVVSIVKNFARQDKVRKIYVNKKY